MRVVTAMRGRLGLAAAAAAVAVAVGACGLTPASPSPSPTSAIQGGIVGPFAFAYPSSWTISRAGTPQHYRTVFGFVLSPQATASETCAPDHVASVNACTALVSAPSGAVAVTLSAWVQPPCTHNAQAVVAADVASGWTSMTVSGLPAAYDAAATNPAGFTRTWEIAGPMPGDCNVYEVKAQFGPSAESLAQDVDYLVHTIQLRMPNP